MPEASTQTDEQIMISPYINLALVVHHLLLSAGTHSEDILQDALRESDGGRRDYFESFLAAFDEWMSK